MVYSAQLKDEQERLEDLLRLGVLQTENEENFDRNARFATALLKSPIALVPLVDDKRWWFKARVGLNALETPRELSCYGHAIGQQSPFVVPDVLTDERFRDNSLVAEGSGGSLLRRRSFETGRWFGLWNLVCKRHDSTPGFSEEVALLTDLALIVSEQMEQRLRNAQHEGEMRDNERVLLLHYFYEAMQLGQSRFIGGGEPDEIFGTLLNEIAERTGSDSGCLAESEVRNGAGEQRVLHAVGRTGTEKTQHDLLMHMRRCRGTHLGLPIGKHLAKLMGGKMWVDSELGEGFTFHFTIAGQSVGTKTADDLGAQHSDLSGESAIVVDANDNTRDIPRRHAAFGNVENVFLCLQPLRKQIPQGATAFSTLPLWITTFRSCPLRRSDKSEAERG